MTKRDSIENHRARIRDGGGEHYDGRDDPSYHGATIADVDIDTLLLVSDQFDLYFVIISEFPNVVSKLTQHFTIQMIESTDDLLIHLGRWGRLTNTSNTNQHRPIYMSVLVRTLMRRIYLD